jgi:leucyl/phenylalanyl-tRNA--protein transferase
VHKHFGALICRVNALGWRAQTAMLGAMDDQRNPIIDPALVLLAYRSGIFPMADSRSDPDIFWVEPKRRGIMPLDGVRVSHSLARTLRRGRFRVTCNAAFAEVVAACAAPRLRESEDGESAETWISHRIAATYQKLHEMGHAHSVECWMADGEGRDRLVGGLYGVGFDRVFCGESMFSRVSEASKVALCWLAVALKMGGVELLDCQFITPHLASLGAIEISQKRYLSLLREAQRAPQLVGERRRRRPHCPTATPGAAWAQARPCRCPRLSAPWRRP